MNFSLFSLFLAFINRYNHAKGQTNKASRRSQSSQIVPAKTAEKLAIVSSTMASFMFAWAIICQYSPSEVRSIIDKLKRRIKGYFNPYVRITIHEFPSERMKRSEAYALVEAYLSSIAVKDSERLRADAEGDGGNSLVFSMDDFQCVTDEFRGAKIWWDLRRVVPSAKSLCPEPVPRRFYKLTFQKRHRDLVSKCYLDHVMRMGKEIKARNRQRKLHTNCGGSFSTSARLPSTLWCHTAFEHPASFESMALDPKMKEEIVEDLLAFSRGKSFYERVGKAWKRGYLLYGPPGTGKSTMIAAMANLLGYDVYDLELTAVKDNTELRRLLIETASRSIIVIEDIDCCLDLSGQRKKMVERSSGGEGNNSTNDKPRKERKSSKEERSRSGKVTLSGLLNFIDGVWSACGSERLIVLTTNHVDKLDQALIRKGRMDKHIELSYCSFEGFKVLAKNYLGLEYHETFGKIESLIKEVRVTPADVVENLMPKSPADHDPERCLSSLIRTLEEAKEEAAKRKAEEANEAKEEVQVQDDQDAEKPER